jgi:hypothetical protein
MKLLKIPNLSRCDLDRFWSKVDVRGENECWMWKANPGAHGYGLFHVGTKSSGGCRMYVASRVSFVIANKGRQSNLVCHTCDTPGCVNPRHLYSGDHKQNRRDRNERRPGVVLRGSDVPNSKLTESEVMEIRSRYKFNDRGGRNNSLALAREFKVTHTLIRHIVRRRIWKHV